MAIYSEFSHENEDFQSYIKLSEGNSYGNMDLKRPNLSIWNHMDFRCSSYFEQAGARG